jgi:hypothetical protein
MSGQIFISYRRDDSASPARRLYHRILAHFPKNVFIDVDNLGPFADFVETIEASVGSCDAFIAVIGKHWLISSDEKGRRRLDSPDDFVRLEIATALKRNIRVIPVLVDGASMPRSSDLPDELKPLVRWKALVISHNRFNADSEMLVAALERILAKGDEERQVKQPKTVDVSDSPQVEQPKAQSRRDDEKKHRNSTMIDVFISYAREDKSSAILIAQALEREGVSVWWDRNIAPGKSYDRVIEEALDLAKCIVVLWSKQSVTSDWVKDEAEEGNRRGILVPASIEEVKAPLGFRRLQTANLVGWKGEYDHPEFREVLSAVKSHLPHG